MLHHAVTFGSLRRSRLAARRTAFGQRRHSQHGGDLPPSGGPSGGHLGPPKWTILAEDDHAFDVQGLLKTLAYFNSSVPMTLGEGRFHDLLIHRDEPGRFLVTQRGLKCERTSRAGGTYNIVPFRNPSIWTAAALEPMGPGLLAGALRHQCHEAANTHDVTVCAFWALSLFVCFAVFFFCNLSTFS